jgi:hypothetical protein
MKISKNKKNIMFHNINKIKILNFNLLQLINFKLLQVIFSIIAINNKVNKNRKYSRRN